MLTDVHETNPIEAVGAGVLRRTLMRSRCVTLSSSIDIHQSTMPARSRNRADCAASHRNPECAHFGLVCSTALMLTTPAFAADPAAATTRTLPAAVPGPEQAEPGSRDTTPAGGRVEVWVDLTLPALAAAPMASAPSCKDRRHALGAQQAAVAEQLRALGATELARVQLVRNAIAVELPASAVDAVRKLPGVLRVRPVTHRHGIDPPPPKR
jgi:hypothetical protein